MKRFCLIAAFLLSACAMPLAQPAAYSPPSAATPPLVPCCSPPQQEAIAAAHLPPPPPPPERVIPPAPPESPPPPPAAAGELAVAKGNRAFAVSLYRQLAAQPGNVFISPISLAGAFGPVAAGARGKTRAEIGRVLEFPADDKVLNADLGSVLHTLEGDGDRHQVSIANSLWLGKGWSIEPAFVEMVKRSYGSEVETLNFGDSSAAAARINAWVDRKTNNRIPELFKPDAFDPTTALVVTDAVYFHGDWKVQFDDRRTRLEPFHLVDGTTRQVPMMVADNLVGRLLGPEPGAASSGIKDAMQVLELPYNGDRLSMVLILPNTQNGLPALEAQLSPAKLEEWLQQLNSSPPSEEITAVLPKVQIESSYDLVKPLQALGIKLAFVPSRADFTGISKDRGNPLFINDVVHKAFLRIDEKGTEAAAATGIEIRGERGGPSFFADHPFLFLIRDKPTGAILFMGRYSEPPGAP